MKKIWLWLISLRLLLGLTAGLTLALGRPSMSAAVTEAVANRAEVNGVVNDAYTPGLEVYHAAYCGTCHALRSAGTTGMFGPPHDAVGVIAGARIQDPHYHGAATTAEAYIRESIVAPNAYLVPGYGLTSHHMPAYTALNKNDLDALVTMLSGQTGAQR